MSEKIVEEMDLSFIENMSDEEIGKQLKDAYGKIWCASLLAQEKPCYPFGATLDEMDLESFFNMRSWLEEAIEKHGGEIQGGGIGMGSADLDFSIEGALFNVQIKPRPIYKAA